MTSEYFSLRILILTDIYDVVFIWRVESVKIFHDNAW